MLDALRAPLGLDDCRLVRGLLEDEAVKDDWQRVSRWVLVPAWRYGDREWAARLAALAVAGGEPSWAACNLLVSVNPTLSEPEREAIEDLVIADLEQDLNRLDVAPLAALVDSPSLRSRLVAVHDHATESRAQVRAGWAINFIRRAEEGPM